MAELHDVEILYPGIWNGYAFNNQDIVESVNNSNYCLPYTNPHLSLNHDEVEPELIRQASFGIVAHFRMCVDRGTNIALCTFCNVRQKLADWLKYHYPRRSVEFYERYVHPKTGEILRNVIFGVSFLGARMPPAVKGMAAELSVSYQETIPQPGRVSIIVPVRSSIIMKSKKRFAESEEVGGGASQIQPLTQAESEDEQTLSPTTNEFGLYIAKRRAELGLTEAQVAEKMSGTELQISEQSIKDMERGMFAPTQLLMKALARALDLQVETVYGLMVHPSDQTQQQFSEQTLRRIVRQIVREFQEEESLGAYLKRVRKEKAMSLEDLAMLMEVTTEELAAVEEADIPDDSILEKLAAALELDYEDLVSRRDAMKVPEEEAEQEDSSGKSSASASKKKPKDEESAEIKNFKASLRKFAQEDIAPLREEMARIKRERDFERQQRRSEQIDHFLETLSVKFRASKLLTGERIRTLLIKADNNIPVMFAEGAKPRTAQQELMDVIEGIARIGVEHISVPSGQMTEPGKSGMSQGQIDQIHRFQQQHKISSFSRAATLYFRQQREGEEV